MRLTLDCVMASRFPTVIVAIHKTHNGPAQSLSHGANLCIRMRAQAANAAALTATAIRPVTGVGAPSYTSGIQK